MTPTILATNPSPDLYGASRMLLESVRGLRVDGWDVAVTIPEGGSLSTEVEQLGATFHRCAVPVLRKGDVHPLGLLRLAWEAACALGPMVRLIRRVRPDVLYVSTLVQPLWIVVARLLRVPVLCHVHEGESEASSLLRRVLAWPLLLTDRILVNSRFSTGVLVDAVPRLGPRCQVVDNGVAGPSGGATPPREALDPPVRLLYLGRLSERKGVRDAVDAVAALVRDGVDCTLDIVGDVFPGYEWVQDDLRERIDAGGIADRVRQHGFDPDVWPHLGSCDVLLVPSRVEEPFGNVAVEGLLAARPVVATHVGGLPEATDHMASPTLVPRADPEALAAAVAGVVARWSEVRRAAVEDAGRAASRFAPVAYGQAVAAAARAIVKT